MTSFAIGAGWCPLPPGLGGTAPGLLTLSPGTSGRPLQLLALPALPGIESVLAIRLMVANTAYLDGSTVRSPASLPAARS
jgi:hypothetical protein